MKPHAPRFAIGLFAIGLLQFALGGCTPATGPAPAGRLMAMSAAAGTPVHAEEVFTISRGNETVTMAPIAGWEQIPATALRNGVDFGYAYFATSEPRVPAGYYRLRATADVRSTGTIPGRVQLIDRAGRVAAEIAAEIEVHSLTVPERLPFPRTFVTAITEGPRQFTWYRCPNGVCIRWPLFLERAARIPVIG